MIAALVAHPPRLHGIYAVTKPRPDLAAAVAAVLRAGVQVVQYRDKAADAPRRLAEAQALRRCCSQFGALLIINDDVELAAAVDADGVHLGRDDNDVAAARQRLGEHAWIGGSCYDDLPRARALAAQGVDYLAFGSLFASSTKPDAQRAPLALLSAARAATGLPVVGIGGIDRTNVAQVAAAGGDAAAVITALFSVADPQAAAEELVAAWRRSR